MYSAGVACTHVSVHCTSLGVWKCEDSSQEFLLSFYPWVPGLELRSSGLVAHAVTLWATSRPKFTILLSPKAKLTNGLFFLIQLFQNPATMTCRGKSLQCLYGRFLSGTKVSKQMLLELPSDVVEGSARSFVTVVGEFIKFLSWWFENLDWGSLEISSKITEWRYFLKLSGQELCSDHPFCLFPCGVWKRGVSRLASLGSTPAGW